MNAIQAFLNKVPLIPPPTTFLLYFLSTPSRYEYIRELSITDINRHK